jgi:hypothetical protein
MIVRRGRLGRRMLVAEAAAMLGSRRRRPGGLPDLPLMVLAIAGAYPVIRSGRGHRGAHRAGRAAPARVARPRISLEDFADPLSEWLIIQAPAPGPPRDLNGSYRVPPQPVASADVGTSILEQCAVLEFLRYRLS